jgi:hypothetical protein
MPLTDSPQTRAILVAQQDAAPRDVFHSIGAFVMRLVMDLNNPARSGPHPHRTGEPGRSVFLHADSKGFSFCCMRGSPRTSNHLHRAPEESFTFIERTFGLRQDQCDWCWSNLRGFGWL